MLIKPAVISAVVGAFLSGTAPTQAAQIAKVEMTPGTLRPLPTSTGGRVLTESTGGGAWSYRYQWPGTYFEAAFEGNRVYFKVGPGDEILHLLIDNQPPVPLLKPPSGLYLIDGLANGAHSIRIEVVTESQAAPGEFGGFALPAHGSALTPPKRRRQIEFIGDSYTVGYGNVAAKPDCTIEEVWTTTDNSQAFGPLTARHYDADYQINAISGHGIVRNYNGGPGDSVPIAYPFVQFDKKVAYEDKAWRPQIIVIGLGTNDFSTPLHPGEKWKSADELHASYEATYVKFVQDLRARNSAAFFILMATDGANGEIQSEVKKVRALLKTVGESKTAFIPMNRLTMTGCHWHPSTADDKAVSEALVRFIDANPQVWQGK